MGDKRPWMNSEGYSDPTAYKAMQKVSAEEQVTDDTVSKLVTTIKNILDLSGFELIGRIQIRHRKSGKIYK